MGWRERNYAVVKRRSPEYKDLRNALLNISPPPLRGPNRPRELNRTHGCIQDSFISFSRDESIRSWTLSAAALDPKYGIGGNIGGGCSLSGARVINLCMISDRDGSICLSRFQPRRWFPMVAGEEHNQPVPGEIGDEVIARSGPPQPAPAPVGSENVAEWAQYLGIDAWLAGGTENNNNNNNNNDSISISNSNSNNLNNNNLSMDVDWWSHLGLSDDTAGTLGTGVKA